MPGGWIPIGDTSMIATEHGMAPGSTSTPRRRTKMVSAQHTQERVRNNQRRHRARRKDYIAKLEQKVNEAEQTISVLRDQVEALQALSRCRRQTRGRGEVDVGAQQPQRTQIQQGTSPPPLADTDGQAVQTYGGLGLSATEDHAAWELPALAARDQVGLEVNLLISPPRKISPAPTPTSQPRLVTDSALNQVAAAETEDLLPATILQSPILSPTTPCCSHDLSSDSQPTVNTTSHMALVPSQETPLLMPGHVLQPAMETYYQAWPRGESTMSCSEAYTLISQQNFKRMNQGDVATWLWNGFRKSPQPGEGCRVQTDILFSLLAFISDTSFEVLTNVT